MLLTQFLANLAGRTECNLFDITRPLDELGASHGFPSASEIGNCLVGFGTVRKIIEFVDSKEEIPFVQPVPKFLVVRDRKLIPSFEHMNENPPSKHIPSRLPAFPDPRTYIHTPMWNERESKLCADKIEQARQQRKSERALLRLQQRLAFASVIEAMKGGLSNESDGEKMLLPEKRVSVRFNFRTGKKILGELLELCLQKKGKRRATTFLRNEERDDKNRRAEFYFQTNHGISDFQFRAS
ncbi:Aminopeptidase-like protein AC3.5 [Hibiscus syriacus]|uniref:Transcription initiation factor TFIID subunit 8 n=1 Tax=Hibiscus syriacus TaxID=106335 RepID=A0A6A2WWS2_HIBSY|nr:Aminopeptidase-like protein AC3.5 [Hibiscus syriacus]